MPREFTPALFNDPTLTRQDGGAVPGGAGRGAGPRAADESWAARTSAASCRAGVPGFYFFLGSAPPEAVAEARRGGRPLPLTHSDGYYPVPEPTIKTGVLTMSLAVLNLLGK